jgi:hypothetical protein
VPRCVRFTWRTASSPSNRRSATLSIRPQRSLCVDRMGMGRVRSASWRRWQWGRVTGSSNGVQVRGPGTGRTGNPRRTPSRSARRDSGGEPDPTRHRAAARRLLQVKRSGPRRWRVRSRMPLVERPRGYPECVPRPRRDLTTTEKRHLHSLEGRISRLEAELQATRREWAELVEEAGQAAVARELGVSRQAVADRLRRIRANREGRSGRR